MLKQEKLDVILEIVNTRGTITVKDNKPRGTIFEIKVPLRSDIRKRISKS